MNYEREGHEAVLLQDGKVLVIGGYGKDLSFLRSTEIYDPNSDTWSITDSMKYSRVRHSATLLENGTVLVAGGISYSDSTRMEIDIADCEIYNPQTGKWIETNPMIEASSFHSATKIKNNKILVTKNWTSFCQIYDGNSGLWKKTGSLNIARLGYEQLILSDGRVLVVGGLKFTGSTYITISDAEIFNP